MQPGISLARRDPFADAKETLSSWDNCMAKDYCKWPVIVAIIIGGLIAFSVVFCIARCICCGAECALCCCKCCTCCCGSNSGHQRMQSANQGYPPPPPYPQQPYASPNPYAEARSFAPPPPPPPQISTQYQSHPAPAIARQPSNPLFNPQVNPKFARPGEPEQPQYATFDAHSKPVNEDALPAMPSWNNARSVQVEVEEEAVPEKRGDVELDRLNHNGSVGGVAGGAAFGAGGAAAAAAGMRGSPGPGRSPVSPLHSDAYGYQGAYDGRGSPAQLRNMSPAQAYNESPAGPYNASPVNNYNTSPTNNYNTSPAGNYNASPAYAAPQNTFPRGPSPAQSYSQYSQASSPYDGPSPASRPPYTQPYTPAPDAYNAPPAAYNPPADTSSPHERYHSPAPPSYHTTAQPNPYAYDPVPRAQTATPSAYPGQQTYQAFAPGGGQQQQGYTGVSRKPVEGSLREV